jgi:hypothetical protein
MACTLLSCQKEELLLVEKSNHDLTVKEFQTSNSNVLLKEDLPEYGITIDVFRSTCIISGETIEIEYHLDPVFQNAYPGDFFVQWKNSSDEVVKVMSTELCCVCGDTYTVEIYKGGVFLGDKEIEVFTCPSTSPF